MLNLKKLLTKALTKLKDTSEEIVYYDRNVSTSISAGTIGTRGAQVSFANPAPSSYFIHSISIRSIGDSGSYLVLPFYYSGDQRFYVNFYRCTSSAVNVANATVRITYTKTEGGGAVN